MYIYSLTQKFDFNLKKTLKIFKTRYVQSIYASYAHTVIVRLFVKAKDLKQAKCSSVEEWLNKYLYNGYM